ncbi:c-type cytochrome biogenesis protein CcsB [Nocardioides phosphati]|uniref:C-type cytochrome biogenesis protein CcsB n=1 Tax=Nocardioides phosphati TaxID=1867775 RepID=A0ABQ2NFQ1_9ACTN|nr:c-type cytochrome biogenesis protein CcsB [Nocardioides phosphati]GGO94148.1 c-type cytochrome biogenesis protein CcsB [Nocardioides phosphati]
MTDQQWDTLSIQAVSAAGVVYFLALLAYSAQWAARRGAVEGEGSARAEVFARFAFLLTVVAGGVHLLALVARGFAADPNRVPWGNMYEFTLTATFVVTLVTVLFFRRWNLAFLGPWAVGLVMVVLMLDVVWLYEPIAPLTEALSSPWLVIHVIAAITATGVFTLGGLVSILYLLRESGRLSSLPAADVLDRISYRLHAFAFPIWTFAVLIAGPIWAHQAWSRYWGWDPKEVWAFITWVVYAAYLHARATAGWKGRAAAIVALVGLGTLWFNFIGINFFFGGGLHSYAKP